MLVREKRGGAPPPGVKMPPAGWRTHRGRVSIAYRENGSIIPRRKAFDKGVIR